MRNNRPDKCIMDIICADEIDAQARDKVFDISEPVSLWWAAAAFEDKYLCLDCVEICKTHSKEELISYFNRFVKAMAEKNSMQHVHITEKKSFV